MQVSRADAEKMAHSWLSLCDFLLTHDNTIVVYPFVLLNFWHPYFALRTKTLFYQLFLRYTWEQLQSEIRQKQAYELRLMKAQRKLQRAWARLAVAEARLAHLENLVAQLPGEAGLAGDQAVESDSDDDDDDDDDYSDDSESSSSGERVDEP